jgi:TfoX/Sxy family transcriptional regulator of competence genes
MAYNEELAGRLRLKLKGHPGIVEKKMFGGVGYLLNGNMTCGVYKDDLIVRLGAKDFEAALKKPNVRVFDITGRPMKGWILVQKKGLASHKALQGWIDKSLEMAAALPPK